MNIAIIGARGCVGSALVKKILETTDHTIVASYRREEEPGMLFERVQWRRVNLYDDLGTEEFFAEPVEKDPTQASKGDVDILVYLVHSLEAKKFENLDRRFADRAGKFAKKMGVKKIIYLGGIIPDDKDLSVHLRSRREVGTSLAGHGVPVAEIRASILLGICSVSYAMVYWLSRRLPILIMPTWSRTKCSPIALEDAVDMIAALIPKEIAGHEIFEIGSETMSYDELLMRNGKIARRQRNKIMYVPLFPILIAAWGVELLTGVSRRIAAALMRSLKNDSMTTHNRFAEIVGREPKPVDETLLELHKKMERQGIM